MNRRLLFVVNVDWFFLSHRLPIAIEAMRKGYEVHIATRITDKLNEIESYGLIVHPLNMERNSAGPVEVVRTVTQCIRVIKKVRPDLVHLVTIKPVLLGGIATRLVGVPAVVSAVTGLGHVFMSRGILASLRRWTVTILYRWVLTQSNQRIIFQNPDDKARLEALVQLPKEKLELIRGSGVNLAVFKAEPLPEGTPVVLLASRLLADKGVREFVEAARQIRQSCLDPKNRVRFVLVGEPDSANPTSVTARELARWAKDGDVELWGRRSDMPQVMGAAHIVVLPSYYGEGLPKVLIEAAACGRVVVTTDHPGCRDAIEAGVSGVLIPTRNANALADAIRSLLADMNRCAEMGRAGRLLAEREFDVRKVVEAHLRIYGELLAAPS
jgi:glycosyltransferase involved in cell wall biosynthesis